MKRIALILIALALMLCGVVQANARTHADLSSDFSFTKNPNAGLYGTWSLNAGNSPLTQINSWVGSPGLSGWGPAANTPGDYIPFFTQVTPQNKSLVFSSFDAPVGTVIVHSLDSFNGDGNGLANATWTSGIAGPVTVSGELWYPGGTANRLNDWALVVGGKTLASGTIPQDGSNSSSHPITFDLSSVPLTVGEQVQLFVTRDPRSAPGNFAAIDMTITSATPEPCTLMLLGIGLTGLAGYGWRRRKDLVTA